MADNILRLKVDSQEYDNKIKRAAEGIQALGQNLQKVGKTFLDADKDQVSFVKALGQMSTVSQTAKGKVGELSAAFVNLSAQYKHMTDQEKQSPIGQAMAESLEQLKQRTVDAKNELKDFEQELQNIGDKAEGFGSKFAGMIQVFGGNMLTQATNQMGEIVSQSIELARSSEGVEIAFNRLNRPDLLNQLKEATHGTVSEIELMKAAVKFDDFKLPVEELGTMLAFAQKKAKDTGQSVDYMVDSIVTGLGRKSLMILDNLGLSANEVKEKMKETGDMTTAVGAIIREQMAKAGGYVDTAADKAARAAADQQNAMRELGKSLMPIAQVAATAFSAITTGATTAIKFLIDNKNIVITLTSAVAAYTLVIKANTIATLAQKAATNAATVAQKALNLAQKASPMGLVAAAAAAAVTAIVAYGNSSAKVSQQEKDRREVAIRQMQRERAERDRLAAQAKSESNAISTATSEILAKYKTLQTEWNSLKTIQEKNNFLKDNASAFDAFGVSIRNAADAQKFFVEQSGKVLAVLSDMAKSDAIKELLKGKYIEKYSFDANNVDSRQYKVSTAEMRQLSPNTIKRKIIASSQTGNVYERLSDSYLKSVIQNHILKNPELKASGFNTGDFKWDMKGTNVTFHMNATGLSKLEEYRKNKYVNNVQDENDASINRLENELGKVTAEYTKKISELTVFKGSGSGSGNDNGDNVQKRLNDALSSYTQAIEQTEIEVKAEKITEAEAKKKNLQSLENLWKAYDDAYRATKNDSYKDARDKVQFEIVNLGKEIKKSADEQKKAQEAARELEQAQKKLADAQNKLAEARLTGSATAVFKAQQDIDKLQGKGPKDTGSMLGNLKQTVGIEVKFDQIKVDETTLTTLLKDAIQNSIDTTRIDLSSISEQISKGIDIPEDTWKTLLEQYNALRKQIGLEPIQIDIKTGGLKKVEQDGKKAAESFSKAADAVGSIGTALQAIEDPGAKVAGIIANAIANIVQSFAFSLKGSVKVWDWIAGAAAGTATLLSTIAAVKSATKTENHAAGGFIGGNSYSGDNLMMPINSGVNYAGLSSGELVLNRAQQGNLAAQLSDNGVRQISKPYVSGELIYLGMNNYLMRTGRGEIVTSR